jgi:hypothetical protein
VPVTTSAGEAASPSLPVSLSGLPKGDAIRDPSEGPRVKWRSRGAVLTDDGLLKPGMAATDPEYVRCDHGYLRRGWCDECHADARDRLDRADPWLTALRSRAHERRARRVRA